MRAVGIILAGGNNEMLDDLTQTRATSAMPVGSCYRAIDFPLSNMSNSDIRKIAVITQFNSRSLHDHLSSDKWWDIGRKKGGLFIFTPYISQDNDYWYRGTADSIYQNISYLKRSNEPAVIIASGNSIYKMDYRDVLDFHQQNNSEVTLICKDLGSADVSNYGVVKLDDDNKVVDFEEKPDNPKSSMASLGIYVIQRTLLIKLLESIVPEGGFDLVRDIIIKNLDNLNVYGYAFDNYWSSINSIESFYNINMDFLKKDVRDLLLSSYPYVETKPKDEPPVKYNQGASVIDSLVASGSILNGSIKHSVLFRRVFTGDNTTIEDSIIMEGCYIGNNCVIKHAILDKEVVLSDGKTIIGTENEPVVIKKRIVV